ncbi:bifunctional helix-turn-helix domain-containing protein/methylated-DNA--[protein]-cysteine S-methyltransferase [Flagellimonas myxillae]|uniref:bifunctional helix-turn-helix domain-containing protein/methylated-DNA--[protein]-cysteine S-methyltransferase n=1 Tax=Flagellimonas myxillae TaxID=2942214 RepID=UPI00201EBDBF|nr:methylated-DNA--[protein]-cysteine S-methyltransferase [Muricauda myxillae]MCL6266998.1 methylated-DNA--[protein]-cysteine S-methyltransferase [Muricauda myxillae]
MNEQDNLNYDRIAKAIGHIRNNFREQPSLDEIAEHVHLSPFHFQRLFKEWAGVSPKKFLQYTSVEHAKSMLRGADATLFDTAMETGLSGTSRLHDLFISIEGMTPGEFKNDGENLNINFSYAQSPFGLVLIASTPKGLCHVAFVEDEEKGLYELKKEFPKAKYQQLVDQIQVNALMIFANDWSQISEIKLHLKGTDFQLKVWDSLLKVPKGGLATYGAIAKEIGKPKASRAVGTAIGNNPIAYLIPCHRVIQSSGDLGGYRWNTTRKTAIIGWEAAQS